MKHVARCAASSASKNLYNLAKVMLRSHIALRVCEVRLLPSCFCEHQNERFNSLYKSKTQQKPFRKLLFVNNTAALKTGFEAFWANICFDMPSYMFDAWLNFLSSDSDIILQKTVRKVPFHKSTAARKTHFESFWANICFHMPSLCLMRDSIFCRLISKYCKKQPENFLFSTVLMP